MSVVQWNCAAINKGKGTLLHGLNSYSYHLAKIFQPCCAYKRCKETFLKKKEAPEVWVTLWSGLLHLVPSPNLVPQPQTPLGSKLWHGKPLSKQLGATRSHYSQMTPPIWGCTNSSLGSPPTYLAQVKEPYCKLPSKLSVLKILMGCQTQQLLVRTLVNKLVGGTPLSIATSWRFHTGPMSLVRGPPAITSPMLLA